MSGAVGIGVLLLVSGLTSGALIISDNEATTVILRPYIFNRWFSFILNTFIFLVEIKFVYAFLELVHMLKTLDFCDCISPSVSLTKYCIKSSCSQRKLVI